VAILLTGEFATPASQARKDDPGCYREIAYSRICHRKPPPAGHRGHIIHGCVLLWLEMEIPSKVSAKFFFR